MMLLYKYKKEVKKWEKITIFHYCDTTSGGIWQLSLFVCWKVYLQWFKIIIRELKDQRHSRFFLQYWREGWQVICQIVEGGVSDTSSTITLVFKPLLDWWWFASLSQGKLIIILFCLGSTMKNYLSNILQCRINPRHNKKPTVRWFFPWQYFLIFAAETLLASVKTRVILYFYEKLVG